MFTWISQLGVRSSDGFEVECAGRFTIEYREDDQILTVSVKSGSCGGGPSVSISPDAFARWDNVQTPNSPAKQAEMRANFVAAMKFQGIDVEP